MIATSHPFSLILATPLPGCLQLGVLIGSQGVTQLDFVSAELPLRPATSDMACQVQQDLADYFLNPGSLSQVQLTPAGTPFQRRVWARLREIPVGTTLSYGKLADELASGARAVAAACRANPIPLLIPCHRVVAHAGLGGYMGATAGDALNIKQWLLRHEGALH